MKIHIDISRQSLALVNDVGVELRRYAISSGANGVGEESGSFCTPRGKHVIRAKIGAGLPMNSVLVRRRPTGEIYTPQLGESYSNRDWILTRILWLCGKEAGFNRWGSGDTMRRYIYIHGTPDSTTLGQPGSHGCIRMNNTDMIELFDWVEAGVEVEIKP
jgi:lipoprotein-anchoring transpeptidase ErfK/SrfK